LDISFVILSWNSGHFLAGVLGTLERDLHGSGLTHEILVIDNGSRDDSLSILRGYEEQGLPLTVIPLGHNTGTTFSRNIGLRMAKGRFICVLDSDMEFCEPHTLKTMLQVFETNPNAGIVAPILKYPSGNHQKSFDQFPTVSNKLKRLFFLRKMEISEGLRQFMPDDVLEVNYVISAFWLFRRELMDSIGLLDEKIFYAPEDVDYCLRSWLNGWKVLFCGRTKVIHRAQEISRKKPFGKAAWRHLFGLVYYFRKYGYFMSLKDLNQRIARAVETRELALEKARAAEAALVREAGPVPAAKPALDPARRSA
jgi:GT2 family glycosyltransferase